MKIFKMELLSDNTSYRKCDINGAYCDSMFAYIFFLLFPDKNNISVMHMLVCSGCLVSFCLFDDILSIAQKGLEINSALSLTAPLKD